MSDNLNQPVVTEPAIEKPEVSKPADVSVGTVASKPANNVKGAKGAKGSTGKLLLIFGIGAVLIICCIVAAIVGLGAAGVSIFSTDSRVTCSTGTEPGCGPPVSSPVSAPTESETPDSDDSASPSSLIVWPNTAYYLIGCDFYEVTPAAATRITAVSGFAARAEGDYCYTGGFGEVSPVNSQFVLSVQSSSTGRKEAFFVDLTARTARNLPQPADVTSPNVLRTDYAFSTATNMTMAYQLVGSGDRTEPRLKEISATGTERDLVAFEDRLAAGRGGTTGDEVSLAYNSNGRYVLINDTTAGPVSSASSESFVAVVEVATGRRLASIEGLKGRWISATKFIYQSGSVTGSMGDQKLYSYDVTTEASSVLTPADTFAVIAQALSTQQGYILTQVSSATTFRTKLVNNSTGRVTEISANPLAQRVGNAVYFIETRRCEITDVMGGETESRPGAVLCPMGDSNGIYTHRLMRSVGGAVTVAAEFDVKYPF